LPVPDKQIHDLVIIFEEARYSDHQLTQEDSRRASAALEAVRQELMEAQPETREVADGG